MSDFLKTKHSNRIGLIVLGVILGGVLITLGKRAFLDYHNKRLTEDMLTNLAHDFAHVKLKRMMTWAKGDIKDMWGNSPILCVSKVDVGVQFLSKGPDGLSPSDDDIKGEIQKPAVVKAIEKIIDPEPEEKTVKEKASDLWDKAKSKIWKKEDE